MPKQTIVATRSLTGTAPKRKVFTREETMNARAKEAKPKGPQDDVSNVSPTPRNR